MLDRNFAADLAASKIGNSHKDAQAPVNKAHIKENAQRSKVGSNVEKLGWGGGAQEIKPQDSGVKEFVKSASARP